MSDKEKKIGVELNDEQTGKASGGIQPGDPYKRSGVDEWGRPVVPQSQGQNPNPVNGTYL